MWFVQWTFGVFICFSLDTCTWHWQSWMQFGTNAFLLSCSMESSLWDSGQLTILRSVSWTTSDQSCWSTASICLTMKLPQVTEMCRKLYVRRAKAASWTSGSVLPWNVVRIITLPRPSQWLVHGVLTAASLAPRVRSTESSLDSCIQACWQLIAVQQHRRGIRQHDYYYCYY